MSKKKEEERVDEITIGSKAPGGLSIVSCCACCRHSNVFEHGDDEHLEPRIACLNGVPDHEIPSRVDCHADYFWSRKFEVPAFGWCPSFELMKPKPVLKRNEPWEDDEDAEEEEEA